MNSKLLLSFLLFFFFGFIIKANAQGQKPNIILILADDVGFKSITTNGGDLYSTPNIDALAHQGMNFTQCRSSPSCSPSRFMLLTGKYNFRNYTQWGNMDTTQKTLGNMFQDAGYKTGYYGKTQLGGGRTSMSIFGFDRFTVSSGKGPKYKSPSIYCEDGFIPDELLKDKYSEDVFTDSLLSFMQENKHAPFFIYYSMVSVHKPWQPTPDDSEFANWDPKASDSSFYPSMMTYMDKKVGMIIKKVKDLGIANNTLILFVGDNGTSAHLKDYVDDDSVVYGGKKTTSEAGTHVPLMAYWPGVIVPGSVDKNLIDFTDFLPTFANICNISPSADFGILDGVNFAPQLTGSSAGSRDWIFCNFDAHPGETTPQRWAQTAKYKLYDTSALNGHLLFYNIVTDPDENNPIPNNALTLEESNIKAQLLAVITDYVNQGYALLSNPQLEFVTDSSAEVNNLIKINGGSTIKASGVVWGTEPHPRLSTANHTSENIEVGNFKSLIKGLSPNSEYHVRTYATNIAGTAYSEDVLFTTPPKAPVSTSATQVTNTSFIANWKPVNGIDHYKIDVSTLPLFSTSKPDSLINGFNTGTTPPEGWLFTSKGLGVNNTYFGKASPSIAFENSHGEITSPVLQGFATKLSFWLRAASKNNMGSLLVEGYDGISWKTIDNVTNISKNPVIKTYRSTSSPKLQGNFTMFRFTYNRTVGGEIYLDDISINYNVVTPAFVSGYEDRTVSTNSLKINSLASNKQYYYRVRSKNNSGVSVNSNTISVTTANLILATPVCTNASLITSNSFVANWTNVENADSYRMDVSKSPTFSTSDPVSLNEGFNNGATPPSGWEFGSGISANTVKFGKASPSLFFEHSDDYIITAKYPTPVTNLSFFIKGLIDNSGSLSLEGFDGSSWKTIEKISNISKKDVTKNYFFPQTGGSVAKYFQFRFTYEKAEGKIVLDDIQLNYDDVTPSFIPGYKNKTVTANSSKVTGLEPNTKYYYRVRAVNDDFGETTDNSNTIEVSTASGIINGIEGVSAFKLSGADKVLNVNVFPNPSVDEFNVTIEPGNSESTVIVVTDLYGKIMYRFAAKSNGSYAFGKNFATGTYFVRIVQGKVEKTFKLIKSNK